MCNPAIAEGDVYEVRLGDRIVDGVFFGADYPQCEGLGDLASGSRFTVRATELGSDMPNWCRHRWATVTAGMESVIFEGRLPYPDDQPQGALSIYRYVRLGDTCRGQWQTMIDVRAGHEFDGLDAGRSQDDYARITRIFTPDDPAACGLSVPRCGDKFAVELTPK